MVGPVNNGVQTQLQAANVLKANQTSQPSPLENFEQNTSGRTVNNATQTTTAPNKTEEVASQSALSRNNTRPAPNDPFASNNARGSQLDIKV